MAGNGLAVADMPVPQTGEPWVGIHPDGVGLVGLKPDLLAKLATGARHALPLTLVSRALLREYQLVVAGKPQVVLAALVLDH